MKTMKDAMFIAILGVAIEEVEHEKDVVSDDVFEDTMSALHWSKDELSMENVNETTYEAVYHRLKSVDLLHGGEATSTLVTLLEDRINHKKG